LVILLYIITNLLSETKDALRKPRVCPEENEGFLRGKSDFAPRKVRVRKNAKKGSFAAAL
jgi:hypothetical protein